MQANKIIIKEDRFSLRLIYYKNGEITNIWNYFKNKDGNTDFNNMLDIAGRLHYAQENNIKIIREV